jgi:hypothetical protein
VMQTLRPEIAILVMLFAIALGSLMQPFRKVIP